MTFEDIEFPVYRKYRNGKNYFKILNLEEFEELQIVGNAVFLRRIKALQFPEKLFIRDMIGAYNPIALESNGEEFEQLKKRVNV